MRLPERHGEGSTQAARRSERRDQVLDSAAGVFAERGFHGSSMNELARRAGMSVGHIYHYFDNKDGIIEALVDREMAERPGALSELARAGITDQVAGKRLDAEIQRVLDRGRMALWLEILAEAARNPRIAGKLHTADTEAAQRLAAAISERLPGLDKREVTDRANAMVAVFQGLTTRAVYNPGLKRTAIARAFHLAVRELLADPDTAGQSSRTSPKTGQPE